MTTLVLFLAVIATAQACAPPATTSSRAPKADATSATPTTTAKGDKGRKRRDLETVLVTVVTNQKYNPSMNSAHLRSMRAMLNDYAKSKNIVYDRRMVHESVTNVDGKFAVFYTVQNADCGQVSTFARGAKSQAMFITRLAVRCGGRPEILIN